MSITKFSLYYSIIIPIFYLIGILVEKFNKSDVIKFLDQWQTFLGTAVGFIFAASVPILLYLIKKKDNKKIKDLNNLISVEVSLVQTVGHLATNIIQLKNFSRQLNNFISDINHKLDQSLAQGKELIIESGIYNPPVIEINFNNSLLDQKYKSLYLVNRLVITEYIIRWTNQNLAKINSDFERLLAELLNVKIGDKEKLKRIKGFENFLNKYIVELETKTIKHLSSVIVYNRKLRINTRLTIGSYERKSMFYCLGRIKKWDTDRYLSKKNKEYEKNLQNCEDIDSLIEKEVNELTDEIIKKYQKKVNK